MKQLLQLANDFVIQTEFNADLDKDKKPIWVVEAKSTAIGINEVTRVTINDARSELIGLGVDIPTFIWTPLY